ncbi:hypothetical protein ACFOTA_03695 [Chitinophaga sp. GCM10012297]|uniref:DUF4468 domain-containing protein n=1 Tax=Chitinophaga chungangae TaxID=2821488 RepID=A0ABS3Y9D9_9BACT|nr:hypothetical protein [Chitinophaga chungangae]MBO9151296.1 hypothetical protein [Chitinophaga chungangae]
MKKLLFLAMFAGAPFIALQSKAQEVTKGSLVFLKDVSEMKVSFIYDKLRVGELGKEENYIKKKKKEKNDKEAGKGDEWEKSWYADREKRYHPKFIELFSKYAEIKLDEGAASKYVMVVDTRFIEPGYNVGIKSAYAEIELEIAIYDTADLKKPVCKIRVDREKGGKGQFDTGLRIGDAYAKAGKDFGKLVAKKAK